jgi:hypothetical protein
LGSVEVTGSMLSENEQRRLAEIELSLSADDPGFAHRFGRGTAESRQRRRRLIAVVVAVCGALSAVAGLFANANVPVVVVSMCGIGAAGCIFTWKRPARR